jgi:hypothetical protein
VHELLAQAFDRLGSRDSAMVHYRAVVRAWEHADARYHARRARARQWLAEYARTPSGGQSAGVRRRKSQPAGGD